MEPNHASAPETPVPCVEPAFQRVDPRLTYLCDRHPHAGKACAMRSVNRPQFAASSKVSIDGAHEKKQQSQLILTELRARAVRMILEHEHAYAN